MGGILTHLNCALTEVPHPIRDRRDVVEELWDFVLLGRGDDARRMLRRLLGARLHVFVERVPVSAEDFLALGPYTNHLSQLNLSRCVLIFTQIIIPQGV